jgi:hypothetical protein
MNKGNHADHPGHLNGSCPLRHTINVHPYGTSHNGYGCLHTGGHCIKSEDCKERVESAHADGFLESLKD